MAIVYKGVIVGEGREAVTLTWVLTRFQFPYFLRITPFSYLITCVRDVLAHSRDE